MTTLDDELYCLSTAESLGASFGRYRTASARDQSWLYRSIDSPILHGHSPGQPASLARDGEQTKADLPMSRVTTARYGIAYEQEPTRVGGETGGATSTDSGWTPCDYLEPAARPAGSLIISRGDTISGFQPKREPAAASADELQPPHRFSVACPSTQQGASTNSYTTAATAVDGGRASAGYATLMESWEHCASLNSSVSSCNMHPTHTRAAGIDDSKAAGQRRSDDEGSPGTAATPGAAAVVPCVNPWSLVKARVGAHHSVSTRPSALSSHSPSPSPEVRSLESRVQSKTAVHRGAPCYSETCTPPAHAAMTHFGIDAYGRDEFTKTSGFLRRNGRCVGGVGNVLALSNISVSEDETTDVSVVLSPITSRIPTRHGVDHVSKKSLCEDRGNPPAQLHSFTGSCLMKAGDCDSATSLCLVKPTPTSPPTSRNCDGSGVRSASATDFSSVVFTARALSATHSEPSRSSQVRCSPTYRTPHGHSTTVTAPRWTTAHITPEPTTMFPSVRKQPLAVRAAAFNEEEIDSDVYGETPVSMLKHQAPSEIRRQKSAEQSIDSHPHRSRRSSPVHGSPFIPPLPLAVINAKRELLQAKAYTVVSSSAVRGQHTDGALPAQFGEYSESSTEATTSRLNDTPLASSHAATLREHQADAATPTGQPDDTGSLSGYPREVPDPASAPPAHTLHRKRRGFHAQAAFTSEPASVKKSRGAQCCAVM